MFADKDDLERAHKKALELGYKGKVWAIENFLIPEVENGKRPTGKSIARKSIRRSAYGKRVARPVRV
jgi:hypothetical protein